MKYKIINNGDTKSIVFMYTRYKTTLFAMVVLFVTIFAYVSFFSTIGTINGHLASSVGLSSRVFDFLIGGLFLPITIALFNIANLNTSMSVEDETIIVSKQKWLFSNTKYSFKKQNCQLIAKKYGWWTYYRLKISPQPNIEISITPSFLIFPEGGSGTGYVYLKEQEIREIAQTLNLPVSFR